MPEPREIEAPRGKLGVLMPGMGAVATTLVAGVELIKKGLGEPVGSLTQLGTIRLGKRTENRVPRVKEFVPLAGLEDLVFGGWGAREGAPQRRAGGVEADRALPRGLRPALRREAGGHPQKELRHAARGRGAGARGHSRLQGGARRRQGRDGLVRLD